MWTACAYLHQQAEDALVMIEPHRLDEYMRNNLNERGITEQRELMSVLEPYAMTFNYLMLRLGYTETR